MRRWFSYAAAGLLLTLVAALVAAALAGPEGRSGVWFAAGLAYVVQLAAFAALLALRDHVQLFMVGWGAGIMLRFGVIGAVAFWLARTDALPRQSTLLSLAIFVVLLLFLEPFFLRRDRAFK